MKIPNLYKDQTILMFKKCFAMEKIHGTSTHITYTPDANTLTFFSGGVKYEDFVNLFDVEALTRTFAQANFPTTTTIYGEAYGGKCQGMAHIYGKDLRFVAFEAQIGNLFLAVPQAENVATRLGLDFVDYKLINTDMNEIDAERDRPSAQAIKNGMPNDCPREGIVLRPQKEFRDNSGRRIIAKHKSVDFSETATPRKVTDPSKLKRLAEANEIADEWVTEMRMSHILGKLSPEKITIQNTGLVVQMMLEDILVEAEGEIEDSSAARKAICRRAALMYKRRLNLGLVT